jgi:hypothetical protein
VLRAVLHQLRDQEAVEPGARSPLFICRIYGEGWQPREVPNKGHTLEQFNPRSRTCRCRSIECLNVSSC